MKLTHHLDQKLYGHDVASPATAANFKIMKLGRIRFKVCPSLTHGA